MTMPPILFSGSSHPSLAQEVATLARIPLGKIELRQFPDREIDVEVKEKVEHREVYVLQSLALDPNFYLMELLIILDALKIDFFPIFIKRFENIVEFVKCWPSNSIYFKKTISLSKYNSLFKNSLNVNL